MTRGINWIISIVLMVLTITAHGQSVGIGTDFPDDYAILELNSDSRGILIPRMTALERDAILGLGVNQQGLLIYVEDTDLFNYWDGTMWMPFPTTSAGSDHDWYEAGTMNAPTDIGANIYTLDSVGIGTANPTYTLDVRGDILIESGGIEHNIRGGATGSIYLLSNSGVSIDLEEDGGSSGSFRVRNSSNGVVMRVDHSGLTTIDGDVVITDGGNELRFEDEATADITAEHATSDAAPLDIESDSDIDIVLDRDNNSTAAVFTIKRDDDGPAAANKLFAVPENISPLVYPFGTGSGETGGIRFRELAATGTNYTGFRAPDNLTSTLFMTLPTNAGGSNYLLQTNGAGILSWRDPSTLPGGSGPDGDWLISGDDVYKPDGLGTVGIGTSSFPSYLLNIQNVNRSDRSINVDHGYLGTSRSDAIYVQSLNVIPSGVSDVRGVAAIVEKQAGSLNTGDVYGAFFRSLDEYSGATSTNVYGIRTSASKQNGTTGDSYGIRVESINQSGDDSYGIRAELSGSPTNAYGIYSQISGSPTNTYAGFFLGDVFIAGTGIIPSDEKLKRNVGMTGSVLDKIKALEVIDYEYRNGTYDFMNLPKGQQTGFLAQQLHTVIPGLTKDVQIPGSDPQSVEAGTMKPYDATSILSVNYMGLIPYLTKAIQEQQVEIEANRQDLENLKNENESLHLTIESMQRQLNQLQRRMDRHIKD